MSIGLTYQELLALNPCPKRREEVIALLGGISQWNDHKVTAAEAKAAGVRFSDVVWAASNAAYTNSDIMRRMRLWAADCAAHLFEHEQSHDQYLIDAIKAARAYAKGEISKAAFTDVWTDAMNDVCASTQGPILDYRSQVLAVLRYFWIACSAAEKEWQFNRLVARLSDPEPSDF